MSDVAKTPNNLAVLCGKHEDQLAQYSGLDPTVVRRLFDGKKNPSNLTINRLTIAQVPFVLNALKNAQLSDAIAEFPESRSRNRRPR